MKHSKIIALFLIVVMVLTLASCGSKSTVTGTITAANTTAVTTASETKVNLANYVYCTGEYLYKVNTETGEQIKIPNTEGWQIWKPIVYKDFIYYHTSLKDYSGFYRIKTDGTQKHKYEGIETEDFCIANDKIYFATVYSRDIPLSILYRMNLDGTNVEKLAEVGTTQGFEIFNNKIYVSGIKILDLDGKIIKDIPTYGVNEMKVNGDVMLWRTDLDNDSSNVRDALYEYNLKTSEKKEIITGGYMGNLYDTADGYYVYVDYDKTEIHIVNTKTNTNKVLIKTNKNIDKVMIRNDVIYYQIMKSGQEMDGDYYCINKDGTGNKKIAGVPVDGGGYRIEVEIKE